MRTFDSATDFVKYLDSINQDKGNGVCCSPVILTEDIKYTGRGTEEIFEKGYIFSLCGKSPLNYCIGCGENAERLKEAGGKIKPLKKGKTMKEILEEHRLLAETSV